MYYQNEPGIYVYFYEKVFFGSDDIFGHIKVACKHYKSLEDFFWHYNESHIEERIGFSIDDRICQGVTERIYSTARYHRRYVRRVIVCNKINPAEQAQSPEIFPVHFSFPNQVEHHNDSQHDTNGESGNDQARVKGKEENNDPVPNILIPFSQVQEGIKKKRLSRDG